MQKYVNKLIDHGVRKVIWIIVTTITDKAFQPNLTLNM